ncbi:MAG: PqqD family protein [Pyrinomonadaceae bacterium]|nr:PqqD family protein [Pyrinomonadaceae bacterium]
MFNLGVKPKSRQNNIVLQKLKDELLIYDLISDRAFCLNRTSSAVWQQCNGKKTISEIASNVQKEFGPTVCTNFVSLAVKRFIDENLLEGQFDISVVQAGISRRELLQRVAISSAVTLPIVSSLTAPKAVNAQSVCAPAPNAADGCPCSANGNCASGCCGPSGAGCVTTGSLSIGDNCRANCNCPGGCCGFGLQCATPASVANGGNCRVNCECISDSCSGGTCVP